MVEYLYEIVSFLYYFNILEKSMKFSELNENKQHGRPDFPIQLYKVDNRHPSYVMPLHHHKEFEIVRVKKGVLHLYLHNIRYELRRGDVAFIGCHSLHRADPVDCQYECTVCDLSLLTKRGSDRCSSYIHPISANELAVEELPPLTASVEKYIDGLFDALDGEKEYHELVVSGALFSLFAALYAEGRIAPAKSKKGVLTQEKTVAALVYWIDHHYAERFTLNDLSATAGLSPNYLCKIFKEYTGKTPTEYTNGIRVEHVCHELRWGEQNVTEAALSCGFTDISYFCKVFKRQLGMSAKAYLKQFKA